MSSISRVVCVMAALGLCANPVRSEPASPTFAYQGQLKQDGSPINGDIDLFISIWDAEAGGSEFFVEQHDAVAVVNGLFKVDVNATPGLFNGEARWVEVAVRHPAVTGDWTTLTPREMIAATPYATHALTDANWSRSGSAVTNSNPGFVGINRDFPVGSEYFGVHAPVETGYGGMYVTTEGAAAKPFYGYSAGGAIAWHYLDGSSGDWRMHLNGSDRVTVTESGDVGIGNTDPQSLLHVGEGYSPSVSGSVARVDGVLAVNATIVSDGGNLLSRSEVGNRAAVVQLDSSNNAGGLDWHLVSNASSSPYGGSAGTLSIYTDGTNLFSLNSAGRAGLGTAPTNFGRFTVRQAADGSSEGISLLNSAAARSFRFWVDSTNIARIDSGGGTGEIAINASGGNVGIATSDPEGRLHVANGADVSEASGGYLILGPTTGLNIGFDNNEIMARDNGEVTQLYLQNDGGTVSIANNGRGELTMADTIELVSSEGGSDGAQMRLSDAAGTVTFELDAEEGGGGAVTFLRNSLGNTTLELDSDESNQSALRLNEAGGGNRVQLRANSSSAGRIDIRGSNGNYNVVLTRENASSNHGWIDVSDADGDPQAGMYVNSSGSGVVFADTKSFRVPNPRDAATEIWYASLEGPEAAAYARGTGQLIEGRTVIALPEHFVDVCSHSSVTMHLTPRSTQSKGLAFVGIAEGGAVVEELGGGKGSYAFDYLIMDVRAGHESFQVVRPKAVRADIPTADVGDETDVPVGGVGSAVEPEVVEPAVAATIRPSADDRLAELSSRIVQLERLLVDRGIIVESERE